MKFLYVFLICSIGFFANIQTSDTIATQTDIKKANYLQKLDLRISALIQHKKQLDDSFSTYQIFNGTPKKYTSIDTFIHELRIYRDAIKSDNKEEAATARENIRRIKEDLTEF